MKYLTLLHQDIEELDAMDGDFNHRCNTCEHQGLLKGSIYLHNRWVWCYLTQAFYRSVTSCSNWEKVK
jgi:hypothetical protein